jgi:hypothetical protein
MVKPPEIALPERAAWCVVRAGERAFAGAGRFAGARLVVSWSSTRLTACFTLCAAWLTACLTPGDTAYASSVAAIPSMAMITARRVLRDSLAGVLPGVSGRVPNGAIAMLTTTYSLQPRESPYARAGRDAA